MARLGEPFVMSAFGTSDDNNSAEGLSEDSND